MLRIDDYALLRNTQTAALVNTNGSIDWLCLPRLDSPPAFAAVLGDDDGGRWRIAPYAHVRETRRRYRGDALVLETDVDTDEGSIRLVDFMAAREPTPAVVRLVEGVRGRVRIRMEMRPRSREGGALRCLWHGDGAQAAPATSGSLWLRTPVATHGEGCALRADFFVTAGELVPFVLTWHSGVEAAPPPIDPLRALADTENARIEALAGSQSPVRTVRAE